jgi:hypothetical protein
MILYDSPFPVSFSGPWSIHPRFFTSAQDILCMGAMVIQATDIIASLITSQCSFLREIVLPRYRASLILSWDVASFVYHPLMVLL